MDREAANTLLRPLRPSGTNIIGPSQQIAAKNAENTEPMLDNFSFTVFASSKFLLTHLTYNLRFANKGIRRTCLMTVTVTKTSVGIGVMGFLLAVNLD